MKRHKVTLDFTTTPVGVHFNGIELAHQQVPQELQGTPDVTRKAKCVQLLL